MGLILLIAFIATPIIEIALFIEAGERFGLWPTLGAIVLTAIIGTALLRWQGFATWTRAQESLQRGIFPVTEVFAGLCLIAAGALLLTPGFLTDAIGFALFVPAVRQLLGLLIRRMIERGRGPQVWVNGEAMDLSGSRDTVIDGEYESRDTPPQAPPEAGPSLPNPDSPWHKRP